MTARKQPKNNDVRRTRGAVRKPGLRKIAVEFPEDLFNKIKARAEKDDVSFSKKAVELAACGVRDYEDSERHDPKPAPRQEARH